MNEQQVAYEYQDYRNEPLEAEQLRDVLKKLGLRPAQVLRKNDRAYKELGLTGKESDDVLLQHMAEHPTLLQRPIAVRGNHAVIARPIERMLELK